MKILFATKEGIHGGLEMKGRDEWLEQAKAAYAEWEKQALPNATMFTIRATRPDLAFAIIQALDALGQPIDDETREWAESYGRSH